MSFLRKRIQKVLIDSNRIFINKRTVYQISLFGLKQFELMRNKILATTNDNEIESLRTKLMDSLKNMDSIINNKEITQFLLVSKNDQDLDLVIESFKKYKKLIFVDKDEAFAEKFIKLCMLLNKKDKINQVMNDEDMQLSFVSQFNSFLIMNKLMEEQKYYEVIKLFEKYLQNLPKNIKDSKPSYTLNKQKQPIPFGHIRLVFESLLNINTKEAFLKMKEMKKIIENYNSKLNNTSISCCFLLSINQNEFQYAYDLVSSIGSWNWTLINNFKAIALLKMNRVDEASLFIDLILSMKQENEFKKLDSKFFPITLNCLKEAIKDSENLTSKYENVCEKIQDRLFDKDLYDYCVNKLPKI